MAPTTPSPAMAALTTPKPVKKKKKKSSKGSPPASFYIAIRKSDTLKSPAMFSRREDCAQYLIEPNVDYKECTSLQDAMQFLYTPPEPEESDEDTSGSEDEDEEEEQQKLQQLKSATPEAVRAVVVTPKQTSTPAAAPASKSVVVTTAPTPATATPSPEAAAAAASASARTQASIRPVAGIPQEVANQSPMARAHPDKSTGADNDHCRNDYGYDDDDDDDAPLLPIDDSSDDHNNATTGQKPAAFPNPQQLRGPVAAAPVTPAAKVATPTKTTVPGAALIHTTAVPVADGNGNGNSNIVHPSTDPPMFRVDTTMYLQPRKKRGRPRKLDADGNPVARKKANNGRKSVGAKALGYKTFDELFQELKDFKAKHGHTRVPATPMTPLKNFCNEVRREFAEELPKGTAKLLTYDRLRLFADIGFTLSKKQRVSFEQQAVRWLQFRTQHGRDPTPKEDMELYKWIEYTRDMYVKVKKRNGAKPKRGRPSQLTPEWIERLDQWGFTWSIPNRKRGVAKFGGKDFDELFEALKQYKERNGHVRVMMKEDKVLHRFCMEMRREYDEDFKRGKATYLTLERIQKLASIGFSFAIKKRTPFEQNAMAWLEHHTKYGRDPKNSDGSLYEWVRTVRAAYRRMEERGTLPSLDDDGNDDAGPDDQTDTENNDDDGNDDDEGMNGALGGGNDDGNGSNDDGTGQSSTTPGGKKTWRRGRHSNLTPYWYRKLTEWGFSFQTPEPKIVKSKSQSWESRFQQLKEYKQQHGNCLVPKRYPVLGNWVCSQRKQARFLREGKPSRLTRQRVHLLTELGFVFNTKNDFDLESEVQGVSDAQILTEAQPQSSPSAGYGNGAYGSPMAARAHGNAPAGGKVEPSHLELLTNFQAVTMGASADTATGQNEHQYQQEHQQHVPMHPHGPSAGADGLIEDMMNDRQFSTV